MLGGTYCQWCEGYILQVKYFLIGRVHQDRTQGVKNILAFTAHRWWQLGIVVKQTGLVDQQQRRRLLEGQPLIYNW